MAHTLPALPFSFDALEPHIDTLTMQIHHGKHHQAYVDNLNKALAGTDGENKSLEQQKTAATVSANYCYGSSRAFYCRSVASGQVCFCCRRCTGSTS